MKPQMCLRVTTHWLSFFRKLNGTTFLNLKETVQSLVDTKVTVIMVALRKRTTYYRVQGGIYLFMRARTFTLGVLEIWKNKSQVFMKRLSNVFGGSGPTMKGKLLPFHHHL